MIQFRSHIGHIIMVAITSAIYIIIGYFTPREDFIRLIVLYSILFGTFLYFYYYFRYSFRLVHVLGLALGFRLLLIGALPELSNDFYRFLWDGHLIRQGINPFLHTPRELIQSTSIPNAEALYQGMGNLSQGNYTCYPPVHQLVFGMAAWLFPHSISGGVIVMRVFQILASAGTLMIGYRLLKIWDLPPSNMVLYILNPFVIIELTGNLHFEGIMIFFLVLAIYLLERNKYLLSAGVFGVSAAVKLIPLIFMPLILKKMRPAKGILYGLITGITFLMLLLPFIEQGMFSHFLTSLDLYFQQFEFNASLYYIAREIGYWIKGYNLIQIIGILLGFIAFLSVLAIAYFTQNTQRHHFMKAMMFTLVIYYFLATTVHPWYIAPILILSVYTRYRFVVVWSFMVILSYHAYRNPDFSENLWFVAVEYGIVYGVMIAELLYPKLFSVPQIAQKYGKG